MTRQDCNKHRQVVLGMALERRRQALRPFPFLTFVASFVILALRASPSRTGRA